jgi:diguanylate cyclase (GGDEF)-like protein
MQFYRGKLCVEQLSDAPFPVVVEGTPLIKVAQDFDLDQHEQILVMDTDETLLGFVPTSEISRRAGTSGTERRRWFDMPIETLLPTRLEPTTQKEIIPDTGPVVCTPIFEQGNLVGLITKDDALISWKRVSPMLHRATADPVTGLPNRFGFDRRLHEELNRARRVDSSVSVLLIDVDNFKAVNDRFGHSVGDMLLRTVAATLTNSVRSYDYVARFGGDEFAAICFGCRPGEIEIPIRRIQQRMQDLQLDTVEQPLTLSIGAVVAAEGENIWRPMDLVNAADVCLYAAKEHGRDCAFFAELANPESEVVPVRMPEDSPVETASCDNPVNVSALTSQLAAR